MLLGIEKFNAQYLRIFVHVKYATHNGCVYGKIYFSLKNGLPFLKWRRRQFKWLGI